MAIPNQRQLRRRCRNYELPGARKTVLSGQRAGRNNGRFRRYIADWFFIQETGQPAAGDVLAEGV